MPRGRSTDQVDAGPDTRKENEERLAKAQRASNRQEGSAETDPRTAPNQAENQSAGGGIRVVSNETIGQVRYDTGVVGQEYVSPEFRRGAYGTEIQTGWEVGNFAPEDRYIDADGNVTSDPPERGKLLIAKGDVVQQSVARQLQDA